MHDQNRGKIFWAACKQSHNEQKFAKPGTDVMILKIFLPKNFAKNLAFLTLNKAKF
jgi:hypothetical protein